MSTKTIERLTAKEEEVMELIWEIAPCAPKDVVARYPEPQPHVNTIATMFQSLERKGYLGHEAKGRGYLYRPLVEKSMYRESKMGDLVRGYFDNSYFNVVSALVDDDKVNEEELMALLRKLQAKKE